MHMCKGPKVEWLVCLYVVVVIIVHTMYLNSQIQSSRLLLVENVSQEWETMNSSPLFTSSYIVTVGFVLASNRETRPPTAPKCVTIVSIGNDVIVLIQQSSYAL